MNSSPRRLILKFCKELRSNPPSGNPLARALLPIFAMAVIGAADLAAGAAAARLTINSNAGSLTTSSTNSSGSFQLENLSTGGEQITSVKIDVGTAILPDVVFDPAGTAGDPDGKAFELDSFTGRGTPVHSFESPHDGVGSADGYEVLKVTCGASVDFDPGDKMTFSADIDPTSVKGAPGPGPEHSASISGLELVGTTVTVTFSNGTSRTVRTAGLTGTLSANKTSMAQLAPDNLATPSISVPGRSTPFTTSTQPTVRITGPAGAAVECWILRAALYVDGVAGGGYDIDPYEVNKVISYSQKDATIGGSGFVDVPMTLVTSSTTGGINLVAALLVDGSGRRSSSSNILVIDYQPDGGPDGEPPPPGDEEAPSVPVALATNGVTAGSVTLKWSPATDNVAVTGYRVFRNGSSIGTTSKLTFTNGGLTPLTGYDYAVEAYDASGNHSEPATLTVFTPADLQSPTIPGSPQAIPGDGSVQLYWTASTDQVGVAGYRVYRQGELRGTVVKTTFTETGLANGTAHLYAVTAFDAADNESAAAGVSVTPVAGGTVGDAVLRVNAGSGGAFTDPQGNLWEADFGFNTGNASSYTNPIAGTLNPQLYQSRRTISGGQPELTYAFNLPPGSYQVLLHFVETVGSFSTGSRVVDIAAEDMLRVYHLDIFERVGALAACVVEFPVLVEDGQLNLRFPRVASNPTISGIEVRELLPPGTRLSFEEWLENHGLAGMTAGDSDQGGLDNLAEYELQLDPKDPADDVAFCLRCDPVSGGCMITLPPLKPLGNYHLHRGPDLAGLGALANRIATVTRAEIEAMTPAQRANHAVSDPNVAPRAFYQLFFEPTDD